MPRTDLELRLLPALRDCAGQRLCVAYSGGLDSTVLLHLLARLAPEVGFLLSAVHVHHGLSVRADEWVAHCEAICQVLAVPLRIERVQVLRDAGKGLEAAARDARHAVFARQDADWVLLAHHADDQAETLLHRLVRGAGVAGAAAMRMRDPLRRLWRPLLGESRAELLNWAQANGLSWVEDDSNADLRFTRNHLRRVVLPVLVERQPAALRGLVRAAEHFAEADELLSDLARLDAQTAGPGQAGARAALRQLSPARGRNLLRYILKESGELAPDAARLEHALQALRGESAARECFGHRAVCAYRDRLWLETAEQGKPIPQAWSGQAELPWADGRLRFAWVESGGLRLSPENGLLALRPRQGGECLRQAPDRPRRSFKALCQEAGLPVWWREILPLLWCGEHLAWVGGVGGAAEWQALPGEPGWRVEWQGPDGVWRG